MKKDKAKLVGQYFESWVIDGMGQWGIWLPIFNILQSKDKTQKMRQKITGLISHHKRTGLYRSFPWVGCGANLTCTIMWHMIQRTKFDLPPTLFIQV